MNDNHWYPRDPQRYLTDTQWCDYATEVAHVRLIDTYYALGRPIKDEQSRIQNIGKIRDVDYQRVRGNLFELGWHIEAGEWRHKRIEETMEQMEENRQLQMRRTNAATEARKLKFADSKEKIDNVTPNVTNNVTLNVTESKPQPQPQPYPQRQPKPQPELLKIGVAEINSNRHPSIEEIKLQCAKIGLPPHEGEKFFAFYASKGWKVGKIAMKSWVMALSGWNLRWKENKQVVTARPPTVFELKTRRDAIIEEMVKIEERGMRDAFGVTLKPEDTPKMKSLKIERAKIQTQLTGVQP